jgi:hypothetical protein
MTPIFRRLAQSTLVALGAFAVACGAMASPRCEAVPKDQWQPREALQSRLAAAGWKEISRIKVEDGCYEAKGTDDKGRRVEVYFNPKTLEQVSK